MLVMAHHLAFRLQPVADAARAEIVEREPQRHRSAVQRVEHRRAHRRIEEGRQHAAMHDAERIGVPGAGQEAADGATAVDLLEPRAVGRGETGRFCELAEAWRNIGRNGHRPL
jgi:hypothetical protein